MVEAILVYCSHSIVAQAASAHAAGYETTSTAISYALYELARNPQVQQKLQAEVDGFGRERQPSYEDLSSFPYAEAVFSEGMRLHPPVTPFIALVLLHPSTCPALAMVLGRSSADAWHRLGICVCMLLQICTVGAADILQCQACITLHAWFGAL